MGILVPIDPRRNPEVELEWLRGPNCFHARLLTDGRGKFFQTLQPEKRIAQFEEACLRAQLH